MSSRFVWWLLLGGAFASPPAAALQKTLMLESTPPGAQVYLLRGAQRVPLGATPFEYEAEFHSEMSILRFSFELAGHESKTVEVAAADRGADVKLGGRALVADPAVHKQESLRAVQRKINPGLEKALRALLKRHADAGLELTDAARMKRLDGNGIYLELPITLQPARQQGEQPGLPRKIWDSVGRKIVADLESGALRDSGLAGVVLHVQSDNVQRSFSVGSRIETRTEMVCVPGYDRQWESCFTRSYTGQCTGGYRMIYKSCASLEPRAVSELVVDPRAAVGKSQTSIYLIHGLQKNLDKPGILQLDHTGKVRFKEGEIPAALLPGG